MFFEVCMCVCGIAQWCLQVNCDCWGLNPEDYVWESNTIPTIQDLPPYNIIPAGLLLFLLPNNFITLYVHAATMQFYIPQVRSIMAQHINLLGMINSAFALRG